MFSIITVVYNDVKKIKSTIESIQSQINIDLEHIVIDGGSTDGTLEILKQYDFSYFYSGADKGIFNAMNKGLLQVNKDYVVFMNSGDRFHDENTLSNASHEISKFGNPSLAYGDAIEFLGDKRFFKKARHKLFIYYGMVAHHQSMFFNTSFMRNNNLNYNENYKMAADYALVCKILTMSKNICKLDQVICYYDLTGVSQTIYNSDFRESTSVKLEILKMNKFFMLFTLYLNKLMSNIKKKIPKLYKIIRYN